MVRILEFRRPEHITPAQAAESRPSARPEGRSADIIIFPGVRIDRPLPRGGDDDRPNNARKQATGPLRRDP